MIIDFHTHIFPDKIAERTVNVLKQHIIDVQHCEEPEVFSDGTLSGLKKSMINSGVDLSVVLPIATTVTQSNTINNFAEQVNNTDGFCSFGSVHPMQENALRELERIKAMGLKGIKLHLDYQDVYADSRECIAVLKKCEELKLIAVVHAGIDIGINAPVKCTPQRLYNALQSVPDITLVAAHLGGWKMWNDVQKYLVGTSIYFDTSFSYEFMEKDLFCDIISSHKKIVFGTDSPWTEQKNSIDQILSCGFDTDLTEGILYRNAERLLK